MQWQRYIQLDDWLSNVQPEDGLLVVFRMCVMEMQKAVLVFVVS